ncbi:hypothetical protein [Tenacibaculum sp. nBUS_03]|uniref:hypothetical protein n=1 Tax=Tenacibaculum sp. nBUS_03 TaxID=3395320 RepID=UPI003EB715BD
MNSFKNLKKYQLNKDELKNLKGGDEPIKISYCPPGHIEVYENYVFKGCYISNPF